MTYSVIQPPFALQFQRMAKSELEDYARWYRSSIPKRISELEAAVRETPGFESWSADCRPESLDRLGEWFADQIELRSRTPPEIAQARDRSSLPIDVPKEELTDRTISLAMDVGMYVANTLKESHPHLRWGQPFDHKADIDYGQPVLVGFGPMPFNPTQILVTMAYGIARGRRGGKRLREVFDYWSKLVLKGQALTD